MADNILYLLISKCVRDGWEKLKYSGKKNDPPTDNMSKHL